MSPLNEVLLSGGVLTASSITKDPACGRDLYLVQRNRCDKKQVDADGNI